MWLLRCIFIILLVLLLRVPDIVSAESQSEQQDSKQLPVKSDGECLSLSNRYGMFVNGETSSSWVEPCEGEGSGTEDSLNLATNSLVLTIYTSLPAYGANFGSLFAWAIISYLNESSWEYDIENDIPSPISTKSPQISEKNFKAILVHNTTIPYKILQNDASWWWQYNIIFDCYWGALNQDNFSRFNASVGSKIEDEITLQKIQLDLKRYLAQGIDTLNLFGIQEASHGLLALSQEDPRESDTPFQDHPITDFPTQSPNTLVNDDDSEVTIRNDTTATIVPSPPSPLITSDSKGIDSADVHHDQAAVDPSAWDWRRYVGLCMFVFTLTGTLVLTQVANRRPRRELWGNLGTEEGVDALLQTAWKFSGDKMEVYDKARCGYRDDDSILIGGFHSSQY